ncbi:MAG: hypothetical protein ACYDHD_01455 [Vulcanimicrobiaceae bacterium]
MTSRTDMLRRACGALLAVAALAVTVASAHGLSSMVPAGGVPLPHSTYLPMPVLTPPPAVPAPSPSAPPRGTASPLPTAVPVHVIPGQQVPLSKLAPLPPQTAFNTVTPASVGHGHMHPLSATGATIDVWTRSGCSATVGTIFNVGCTVSWSSWNLDSANDTFQDYVITPNSVTATAVGGTYSPGYGNPGPTRHTALSIQGTYVFGTYDTNSGTWDAVVYVVAGSATYFTTYQDATHVIPATNFSNQAGTNVYVGVTGVTATDSYVVYVESTSGNAQCTFIFPIPSSTPAPNTLCNPATSSGQTAPGGNFNVDWQLAGTLTPGTYSIVLFDLTANKRMAQRQIAFYGGAAGNASISITPQGGNPSPAPAPLGTPGTVFAFDGATDTSDASITVAGSHLAANTPFYETISDPNGYAYSGNDTSNGAGQLSFSFGFGAQQAPSHYVGNTYTAAFYDVNTSTTSAALAFKLVGYNALTEFTNPLGTSLLLPKNSTAVSGVEFTNDGDTLFGTGNGDPLSGLYFSTGGNGITLALGAGSSSCGTDCQQQTVTDSTGNSWTVTVLCTYTGANAGCTMTIYPAVAGNSLPMNATLTVPSITFTNGPGNAKCTNGCSALTSILPKDGLTWSATNSPVATNPVDFTNGGGTSYGGTANFALRGTCTGGCGAFTLNQELHGYDPRSTQAILPQNSPFTQTFSQSNGPWDIFAMTVSNTSSGGGNITELEITMPSAFSPNNVLNYINLDPYSPTNWNWTNCPSGAPQSAFCLSTAGGNPGIAPGTNEQIYLDIAPVAPGSFGYTEFGVQAEQPTVFPLAPSGSLSAFVPQATVIDSLAMASYSVNSSLMTSLFTPTSVGVGTTPTVTVSVQNTTSSSDPYPDYLDAIIIALPNAYSFANIASITPAGWIALGQYNTGSMTQYWFGLCGSQFATADGPPANPPPVPASSASLPSCGQATEQSSLAPGATFSFAATLQNLTSPGTITATMYAHGANTDAWSLGQNFNLSVTNISALSGFEAVGPYGSPATVPSNTEPQIGADSNATYGNSYVYQIKNTSSAGHNIYSAVITIPGLDTSGANGTDSTGTPWTITSAPTLSGSGYSGCSVTGYASATTGGGNGNITIGGGSCALAPNGYINVSFAAKAPYKVNSTFDFPTVVNGSINAAESWFSDQDMLIILSAQLAVTVNPPNPGPGGSTPVVNCVPCTFSPGEVNFGAVANSTTSSFGDVVDVSVYTNAANPIGWQLQVTTNNNPARTPTPPTNELLTSVDSTNSSQGTGMNFDQTAYGVVPTSGGLTLVDTGSGVSARRLPYDVLQNYQLNVGTEALAPQTAAVTFTFISN